MALGLDEVNIRRWGKLSKEGLPIPVRCPICRSKKTSISTYKGDRRRYVECEGCFNIIFEYPENWQSFVRH